MTTDENDIQKRKKETYHVTLIGCIANIGLLLFKLAAGILGHSSAMIADALHSLTDFISDLVVLLFAKLSSKRSDSDHQYGHGKYETFGALSIGVLLFMVGGGILWEGLELIWYYLHGVELEEPGLIALIAAFISIFAKEALYHYTIRRGRRIKSSLLQANAWHHRTDAMSSIAAAIGIAGSIILGEQWRILDPLAAIFVSLLICGAAISLFMPAFNELLEKSLPEEEKRRILEILSEFKNVSDPHNLRTRSIGPSRSVEMHVRMPGDMTVEESHHITRMIEKRIRDKIGGHIFINIHVEPEMESDDSCKNSKK